MKRTLRNSGNRPRYGLVGAGAVSASLVGGLPEPAQLLGPVYATAYRVARRIVNTLRGGFAARSASELAAVPVILFHSPPEHAAELAALLEAEECDWTGRCLLVCDCMVDSSVCDRFRQRGASVAIVRRFTLPGYLVVLGEGASAAAGNRLARELKLRPIEVCTAMSAGFEAALTLSTAALTPLLDCVAALLRHSGVREIDAPRLAAALFQQTAGDYAHSGRQSWDWYSRGPDIAELQRQIDGAGSEFGPLLRTLVLLGLNRFGKYPDVGKTMAGPAPQR